MNNEFDWGTAEYPCFGQSKNEVVLFSSFGIGHDIDNAENTSNSWIMHKFKPYTKPKEKEKLWYWEYFDGVDKWLICSQRFTENEADKQFTYDHRKLEALGYIEGD